ncbi:MAG TPA: C39 family peptidase [Aromatoleum sp.]|uniref:C39 family peptidase n=1 Tax=Aromatoleum sp. TaxID=2307007 RepID=UPI002B468E03|nr:C39 family peptidase [Aromatoleum sp.]HJV25586.1 C39 family peptidase [Aromatoleum sp.]
MTMHAPSRIALSIFVVTCAAFVSALAADRAQILGPSGSTYSVPVVTMKGARYASTLHQQYDFSCGSAAVATLLTHHYGHKVDEAEVFRFMFERGDQAKIRREGFSMLDMKFYLDALGFRAEGVQATLDQLASVGIPAIALIKENGYMHFVVVKGVRGRRVVIGDPALGTRVLDRAMFESYWTNHILLVINNAMTQARFNRDEDWRVRPAAPLADAAAGLRDADVMLLRRNPGDF